MDKAYCVQALSW